MFPTYPVPKQQVQPYLIVTPTLQLTLKQGFLTTTCYLHLEDSHLNLYLLHVNFAGLYIIHEKCEQFHTGNIHAIQYLCDIKVKLSPVSNVVFNMTIKYYKLSSLVCCTYTT